MTQSPIRLASELTIRNIQQVHHDITEQLTASDTLCVDASQLTRVDTSGAQLLYFLHHYCQTHHHAIEWTPPAEEVAHTLAELGLDATQIFALAQEKIQE